MAALKDAMDGALVRGIAARYARAWPGFDAKTFVRKATQGLDALELKARATHTRKALEVVLPARFPEAADVVESALGPVLDATEGWGMSVFEYLPEVEWVGVHGVAHFERAMRLQHALTQRFSCEFSIRSFLIADPKRTLAVLDGWARDPSVHVRRLVSEGTRPRLPWAARLPAFVADPRPCLPLLEVLVDDPEEYVRRSVANHVNDISKDHPGLAIETCRRWLAARKSRRRLVSHALRTLVKKGDPGALAVLGAADAGGLDAQGTVSPKRARIGGQVVVEASVTNRGKARTVVLDVRVHYRKAGGGTGPKTFKLAEFELEKGATRTARTTLSLRQMSTRKHHPGRHDVELLVNGKVVPIGAFQLLA